MIFVYTTCASKKEASTITRTLLMKRLCACAVMFPVSSSYWWKGKIESAKEYAVVIKTKKEKFKIIQKEIAKMHSYITPCIIKLRVADINKGYLAFLRKEVR